MTEQVAETTNPDLEDQSEDDIREELYEQFDVSAAEKIAIFFISSILEWLVQLGLKSDVKYDTDTRSKTLAEIALIRAYEREPKFKLFISVTVLLGTYDFLYPFNPTFYGIFFVALATLDGFIVSLKSPRMMAAEIEGTTDEDGMPANFRAKALSIVNTNVTIVLFSIAIGVQLLVTSSFVQGELLTENIVEGRLHPVIPAVVLFAMPIARAFLIGSSDN